MHEKKLGSGRRYALLLGFTQHVRCLQRAFATERVNALLEDRRIRDQDESAHRQLLQQQLEQARQQLAACQKTLQTTTRDFILGMPC